MGKQLPYLPNFDQFKNFDLLEKPQEKDLEVKNYEFTAEKKLNQDAL